MHKNQKKFQNTYRSDNNTLTKFVISLIIVCSFLLLLFFTSLFIFNWRYSIPENRSLVPTIVAETSPTPLTLVDREKAKVAKVIDGDSVLLANGRQVRYVGINTPEFRKILPSECYAQEAYEENRVLVEGKEVELVKDVSESDKYGRLLRYVYLNGVMVNEYLLQNGYARVMGIPPDTKYYRKFLSIEQSAKTAQSGLWGKCDK